MSTARPEMWQESLSRSSLEWSEITDQWGQGAFIGEGMIGAMIYKTGLDVLRWELGRGDTTARYWLDGIDWCIPRIPIGDILLCPLGTIEREEMHLDLWDAEVRGTIKTDRGTISWKSFAHATRGVILIEVTTTGSERDTRITVRPAHGVSPRLEYVDAARLAELPLAPPPHIVATDRISYSVQRLLPGGESAIAWQEIRICPDQRLFICTVKESFPECTASASARECAEQLARQPITDLVSEHRAWWHDYYMKSYIAVPDPFWEKFYWLQIYKLASTTRSDGMLIDNQGVWLTKTPWPGTWYNLNVQLSYSPVYIANRLELGESLIRHIDRYKDNLKKNVPQEYRNDTMSIGRSGSHDLDSPVIHLMETGNLVWLLHNYWRQYRYSMDRALLERFYPLLRNAINFYRKILREESDGHLHMSIKTHSPEYTLRQGEWTRSIDNNYDLMLIRWGCETLISCSRELKIDDPLRNEWKAILDKLVSYPVDTNGLRISAELPLAQSHRHYSHLLAIFPLGILKPDTIENKELIRKSVEHWIGFEGALQGYSYTGASSMYSILSDGEKALEYLNGLKAYLQPNTMYIEAGPVIETPLSGAESLHMMLLQCWDGVIRVFPAVPSAWHDVYFHNLRTEGAFLVSAQRRSGQTAFVEIESCAGEPCLLITDMTNFTLDNTSVQWTRRENGVIELHLRKNQRIRIESCT